MANCDSGNNTLDPYQSIIDGINKSVTTLENQGDIIKPIVDQFDAAAALITTPKPNSFVITELNNLTADAICAGSTDLQPINDLVADCLNEANAAVKRYLKNILSNIEDGVELILDVLTLPEKVLFTYYQRIHMLADSIKDLITGIDNKIQCVTDSSYQTQIDDINVRVDDVILDLRLLDDGSFDADEFLKNLGPDLKANVKSYATHADSLEEDIRNNISNVVGTTSTVNPQNYF